MQFDFDANKNLGVNNTEGHIRSYLADSTRRLGRAPDLYYLHRRDPKITLEESIGTLDALRKEGKVKYIGLSEVSAETLRAACKGECPSVCTAAMYWRAS
jgi:aryl-alcohol dehydrogenase-like predicted oxidoreductase